MWRQECMKTLVSIEFLQSIPTDYLDMRILYAKICSKNCLRKAEKSKVFCCPSLTGRPDNQYGYYTSAFVILCTEICNLTLACKACVLVAGQRQNLISSFDITICNFSIFKLKGRRVLNVEASWETWVSTINTITKEEFQKWIRQISETG